MAYIQGPGGSGGVDLPGSTGTDVGGGSNGPDTPGASGTDVAGGGSSATISNIPKLVLVGGLLLVLLLLLANHFPKFTTGFMLLVLAGVVLSHGNIISSFFNTNG